MHSYVEKVKLKKSSEKLQHKINQAIKDVTLHIENLRYDQALIKLRNLFDTLENEIAKEDLEKAILLLSPFCPHLAEELWEMIKNKSFVSLTAWPKHNEKKINEKFDKEDEIIDKVIADIVNILRLIKDRTPEKVYLYTIPNEHELYNIKEIEKRINKPVFIFKVNDKNKHDPQNKSQKAKPGKPAIFIE